MSTVRMHRTLIAWLAMLAIMFGALAPTLAHAMASGGDHRMEMEVCGSTGMFLLTVDADSSNTGGYASPQDRSEHCPWCCLHADVAVPVQVIVTPLLDCAQEMPAAFYRAGVVSPVWRTALARAPPLA